MTVPNPNLDLIIILSEDLLTQVQDPLNWLVMDNNNNLGWAPDVLGLAGQHFLAPPAPGWIEKRSWTSGFSGRCLEILMG